MIKVDDRNESQKVSHKWAIVAKDKFMSGWGGAKGGASRVAWAFRSMEEGEKVLAWVRARSDMTYVNFANLETYRAPKGTAHFHIYVADANHPSLNN